MRIIHVVDSMDPATGGPSTMIARLAAAQASAGHSVTIFSHATPNHDVQQHSTFAGIPGIDRVTWQLCATGGTAEKYLALAAERGLRALCKPGDVLHLHGVWCAILSKAANVAKNCDLRYALTLHGVFNPASLAQKRWKKMLALMLGRRRMLEHAAFIHTLNEDEANGLRALGIETPIAILPNGIFAEEVAHLPPASQFHDRHPQLGNRPYILFLGRLHRHKGLDYLAQAFALFAQHNADVDLVVAGPDGGMCTEFEQQVERDKLSKRVHVIGPVYGVDKLAAFAGALCFCLPSRNEGFSMAITEALGCGVPVVISRECHFPEVQTAGAGEVVALDSVEIADALLRLTADGVRDQQASHAARRLVLENYTWPRIAARMVEAYAQAGQWPQVTMGNTTVESTP